MVREHRHNGMEGEVDGLGGLLGMWLGGVVGDNL